MTPEAMFGLGVPELLIILVVVLLLFGGSRLAGLGKSTGRALKEFKEETRDLKAKEAEQSQQQVTRPPTSEQSPATDGTWTAPPAGNVSDRPAGDVRRDG